MTETSEPPEPAELRQQQPAGDAGDPLAALRAQLRRLEHHLDPQGRSTGLDGAVIIPAWRRPTAGEKRFPVALASVVAIALQVALPDRLNLGSRYLLPAIEVVMLIVVVALNPQRIDRISRPLRIVGLGLIAVASLANAYSATRLVIGLIDGSLGGAAGAPVVHRRRDLPHQHHHLRVVVLGT